MENDFFSYGYNNKNLPSFLDEKTTQGMIGRMQSYKDKGMYDAFKGGGKDDNKFSRMAGTLGGLLKGEGGGFQPYDEKSEYMKSLLSRPFGGRGIPGSTQRLAGGLTMSLPRAFEPIITPGVPGPQGRSTGQRIAGAAGGALQGAAMGSAIMPGVGTALGAIAGGLGGLFG